MFRKHGRQDLSTKGAADSAQGAARNVQALGYRTTPPGSKPSAFCTHRAHQQRPHRTAASASVRRLPKSTMNALNRVPFMPGILLEAGGFAERGFWSSC